MLINYHHPPHRHTLALDSDGAVWSWGCNDDWTLGKRTVINLSVPFSCVRVSHWLPVPKAVHHSQQGAG